MAYNLKLKPSRGSGNKVGYRCCSSPLAAMSRYWSQRVAVVAFYILVAATGRYTSFTACWLAGCHYMRIAVLFYQFIVIPRGFHPLKPPLITNNC